MKNYKVLKINMKNSTKQKEKSGKKNDAITGKIKQKGN